MPHTFRFSKNEKLCRHDYLGKQRHPVDKKSMLQDIKDLVEKVENLPDCLVVRAAKIEGKKNIYLRPDTVSLPSLKLKNRNEVTENRLAMKKILGQIVSAFEESRGNAKILKVEREALDKIQSLASGDKADITLGDIREPLKILTDSPRNKRAHLVGQHYSPRRTDSQQIKVQINRFLRLSDNDKEILKELLFPVSQHIPEVRRERIVRAMQSFITYKLKHQDLSDERALKKLDNKEEIKQFVDAWVLAREALKSQSKNMPQKFKLFPWADMMDQFCAKLNHTVFDQSAERASKYVGPDGVEDEKPVLDVAQKSVKERPATPGKTNGATIRIPSVSTTPASTVHSPKLRAKKSPLSPLQFAKTMGSVSPMAMLNALGKIPRTESGDLEAQIVFYSRAAAAAKEMADLTRMRLDAIYRVRSAKSASDRPVSDATGTSDGQFNVRDFSEVRDAISLASPRPQFSELSMVLQSQSGMPVMESEQISAVNSISMPLSSISAPLIYPSNIESRVLQSGLSDSSLVDDSIADDMVAIRPVNTGDKQPAV